MEYRKVNTVTCRFYTGCSKSMAQRLFSIALLASASPFQLVQGKFSLPKYKREGVCGIYWEIEKDIA